jgi:hypothetical protein
MSKENIKNLLTFLNNIDQKIFNDVKDLSSIDKEILDKFINLKENLENLENLENFKIIIDSIARETNKKSDEILEKFNYFKKLRMI